MKDRVEIKKAARVHLDKIEDLYNDLNDYLKENINYPGWIKGIYPVRETADAGIQQGNLYIAEIEGKIAGTVILNHEPEEAYNQVVWSANFAYEDIWVVHTLAVHPAYWGYGIGRELLSYAAAQAREQGIKSIRLDVSEHNKPAIALYKKCGYQYIGRVDLNLPYDHLKWFELYEYIVK